MDRRINFAKMSILPKAIYRVSAIRIKILNGIFRKIEPTIQTNKQKKHQIAKAISKPRNKAGGIHSLISSYITTESACQGPALG